MMRLTFLGTGTSLGVPVIGCHCEVCRSADSRDKRLRTSALLRVDTPGGEPRRLLFDVGPDFRQQMLRIGAERVDAILVTHAHRDHVAGIDDIRALNYVQRQALPVYLNSEARTALERDYGYIFGHHPYPGLPEAQLHTVQGRFEAAGIEVEPVKAMHKDLPVLGFRIGPLAYLTDVSRIEAGERSKLEGVEALVVNALRKEPHFSHFCLNEALELIASVRPQRAYLTHLSHEMGLHEVVAAELPQGVYMAYDNLEISL